MRNILKKKNTVSEKLIYLAFASVFLHYVITGLVALVISAYILLNGDIRRATFKYPGRSFLYAFTFYSAFIALVRDNYIGLACSIGFFAFFMISYFARNEMTGDIFQKGLDISCSMSWVVCFIIVAEKAIYSHQESYRCVGWFFNSNYLCTLMAMVVLVCVYKMLISQKGKPFYVITIILSIITMYLGGSIFAFIEIIVGVLTLLILFKRRSLVIAFFVCGVIGLAALYVFPEIFPRILESNSTTDNRILVWDSSLEFIKMSPLFGHGFLSYYHLNEIYGSLWNTAHTHNFVLEPILNFGLIGTAILLIFLWTYYEKIAECKSLLRKTKTTNLILAISTAAIIHCTVDMTIQWLQTGLFFLLILAGIGVDEKTLNRRIEACLAKSQKQKIDKSSEEEL
ncbi:MAG: O-antigen ligase family protein [Clostridia bacterium]|nr:O-antigen ligase family protein [Clostridia bacterium]